MSNETKRDVFVDAVDALADAQASGGNIGHQDANLLMAEYEKALPDDMPVIPKEVSDYIRKTTAPRKNGLIEVFCSLADDIRVVGHDNIYKWELWMLNNQAAVARAWVLGVWIIEETGEIVKLEDGE